MVHDNTGDNYDTYNTKTHINLFIFSIYMIVCVSEFQL